MKNRGFTLIELLITVTVVGVLIMIAYPSYQKNILKSRRTDAKSVLLQAAHWMERFFTVNNRYDQNLKGILVTDETQFKKSGLTQSPIDGQIKYYNITLSASDLTRNSFILHAIPIDITSQSKDPCKTLTLNQAGVKGVIGGATMNAEECWR
ncbi:type IV pilus assembly protein PilE [Gammaproteobacteria bacterium]